MNVPQFKHENSEETERKMGKIKPMSINIEEKRIKGASEREVKSSHTLTPSIYFNISFLQISFN